MFFISEKQGKKFKLFFSFINRNRIIQEMKHQKVLNLLNGSSDFKFLTRKRNIANDQPNSNYGNKIIYNSEVLKSSLCDYNDDYILQFSER